MRDIHYCTGEGKGEKEGCSRHLANVPHVTKRENNSKQSHHGWQKRGFELQESLVGRFGGRNSGKLWPRLSLEDPTGHAILLHRYDGSGALLPSRFRWMLGYTRNALAHPMHKKETAI